MPKCESIGDGNLRRQAQRVGKSRRMHQAGLFIWRWLLSEFVFKIAAILEPQLVAIVL